MVTPSNSSVFWPGHIITFEFGPFILQQNVNQFVLSWATEGAPCKVKDRQLVLKCNSLKGITEEDIVFLLLTSVSYSVRVMATPLSFCF